MSSKKLEQAVAEVKAGKRVAVAAKRAGLSPAYLWTVCQSLDIDTTRAVASRTLTILAALFDPMHSLTDIADQLGVTKQRVSSVLVEAKRAGIPGLPARSTGPKKTKKK